MVEPNSDKGALTGLEGCVTLDLMRRALGRFFDFFVFDVTFADGTSDIAACTGFWLAVSVDPNRDRIRVARLSPSLGEAGKRWPRLRLSADGTPDGL